MTITTTETVKPKTTDSWQEDYQTAFHSWLFSQSEAVEYANMQEMKRKGL